MLEETNGKIHRMSLEAIAGAQSLASESELTVAALAIGRSADKLAEQASQFDLNEILKVDNDQLSNYSSDGYSETLNQVILAESPKYIFFGHTYQVRDYVPKLSAKLMKPFFADNVAVNLNDGSVSCSKQTFNAKLFSDVESSGDGPYLISLQSAAYSSDSLKTGECSIREVTVNIDSSLIKTSSEEPFKETSDDLDLTAADLIVSVGRGIGKEENIPLARELAEAIGAELSSSRPVVDSGWLPSVHQVGSSGRNCQPDVLMATILSLRRGAMKIILLQWLQLVHGPKVCSLPFRFLCQPTLSNPQRLNLSHR